MEEQQLTIETHVGASIEIPVEDIPGSAYFWCLTEIPDLTVLDSAQRQHVPNDDLPVHEQEYGVNRPKTFHFWARRAGEGTLRFELLRPFEPEKPVRSLTVTLQIAPKPRQEPLIF